MTKKEHLWEKPLAKALLDIYPPPSFDNIIPNSALAGTTEPIFLLGRGFQPNRTTTINAGEGIVVSSVEVVSENAIFANLAINEDAQTGIRNISVTNDDLTTNNIQFALPELTITAKFDRAVTKDNS